MSIAAEGGADSGFAGCGVVDIMRLLARYERDRGFWWFESSCSMLLLLGSLLEALES